MRTKEFDCVQLQHQGAREIQKKLAGKTREEQLEYWRKRTDQLLRRQEILRKKQESLNRTR